MASNLQIAPGNQQLDIPNPVSLYPSGRSVSAGGIPGAIGRALGSAQLRSNPDGTLSPAHHILDALLNRGGAANSSLVINQEKAQQALVQQRQLQAMDAEAQHQIDIAKSAGATQMQLEQLSSDLANKRAQVAQGLGVATNAGVVASQPGPDATPGMKLLASDVSRQRALGAGAQAIAGTQAASSPQYQGAVQAGMVARELTPEYQNSALTKIESPGVGGVQILPNGSAESVAKGLASSQSLSQPNIVTMQDGSKFPLGQIQTSSSSEQPAAVTIPTDPDKVQAGLAAAFNKAGQSGVNPPPTQGVSPTPGQTSQSNSPGKTSPIQAAPVNPIQSTPDDPQAVINGYLQQLAAENQSDVGGMSPQQAAQAQALAKFRAGLMPAINSNNATVSPMPGVSTF